MKLNTILHAISAVCGGLVYAFFALPYYSFNIPSEASQASPIVAALKGRNGYEFIKDALEKTSGSTEGTFATVMAIITLVVAGIVLVCSVLALLSDLDVIKGEKLGNIFSLVAFCTAAALALCVILNLVANNVFLSGPEFDSIELINAGLSALGVSISAVAGWALTIITTVLGLGACASNAVAKFKK